MYLYILDAYTGVYGPQYVGVSRLLPTPLS